MENFVFPQTSSQVKYTPCERACQQQTRKKSNLTDYLISQNSSSFSFTDDGESKKKVQKFCCSSFNCFDKNNCKHCTQFMVKFVVNKPDSCRLAFNMTSPLCIVLRHKILLFFSFAMWKYNHLVMKEKPKTPEHFPSFLADIDTFPALWINIFTPSKET